MCIITAIYVYVILNFVKLYSFILQHETMSEKVKKNENLYKSYVKSS